MNYQDVTHFIDENWFPAIAAGDREAFFSLYEAASAAVYAYALTFLHSREEAEDIMQDTFLKIRGATHLYTSQGKPMAWIMTIARNLCLMRLRQSARTDAFQQAETDEDPSPPANETQANEAQRAEDRLLLEKAFRVLKEEDVKIVVLHAVSGLKHREIASLLGIPLPTVLSRYRRALKRLREELEN